MHGGIPMFVHVRSHVCIGQLWISLVRIYRENGSYFFPFSFFQKESGKPEVGVPSLPGGGWGGDGRVHASGANLDLYPAGFYYFYFLLFLLLVLCFYFLL